MQDPIPPRKDVLPRLRHQLQTLSDGQEKVAEAREEVLLERERFRSHGKKVFAQRRKTREVEVTFMNMCREFYNEHGSTFPPLLQAAYESVHREHDKLGAMASDYLEAEEELGANEWAFSEQESHFYQYDLQDLISDNFADSVQPSREVEPQPSQNRPDLDDSNELRRYQAAVNEHDSLVNRFDALRQEQAIKLDLFGQSKPQLPDGTHYSDFQDLSSHLLTQIADYEVKASHLDPDLIFHDPIVLSAHQQPMDATKPSTMVPSHLGATTQPRSNSPLSKSLHSLSPNSRILKWLWNRLRYSAFEKDMYLNTLIHNLECFGILEDSDTTWEDGAKKYWNSSDQMSITDRNDPATTVPSRERQNADLGSTQSRDSYKDVSLRAVKPPLNFEANFNGAPPSLKTDVQSPRLEPEDSSRFSKPSTMKPSTMKPSTMKRSDSCQPSNTLEECSGCPKLSEHTLALVEVSSSPEVDEQLGTENIPEAILEAMNPPLVINKHTESGIGPGVSSPPGIDKSGKTASLQKSIPNIENFYDRNQNPHGNYFLSNGLLHTPLSPTRPRAVSENGRPKSAGLESSQPPVDSNRKLRKSVSTQGVNEKWVLVLGRI